MSADDWNWTEDQVKFLQLVEHNQAREQVLMANGIQLQAVPLLFARMDMLAETVLTEEGYEQYHLDFAIKVSEMLDEAEKELNKRKLMADNVPDISQMNRAERRRTGRHLVKEQFRRDDGSGLITPN